MCYQTHRVEVGSLGPWVYAFVYTGVCSYINVFHPSYLSIHAGWRCHSINPSVKHTTIGIHTGWRGFSFHSVHPSYIQLLAYTKDGEDSHFTLSIHHTYSYWNGEGRIQLKVFSTFLCASYMDRYIHVRLISAMIRLWHPYCRYNIKIVAVII